MLDTFYHITLRILCNLITAKNVIILSLCTQRCYGRQSVSRKSVNHWWFIDFIAWRYFTPSRATSYDKVLKKHLIETHILSIQNI